MTIYSHPPDEEKNSSGTTLSEHSSTVSDRMVTVVDQKYSRLASHIGMLHDVGKATKYFQKYILEEKTPTNSSDTRHSRFGAVTAIRSMAKSNKVNLTEEELLTAFIAIEKHHGTLEDTDNYFQNIAGVYDRCQTIGNRLERQYKSIQSNPEARKVVNKLLPTDVKLGDIQKGYSPKGVERLYSELSGVDTNYTQILQLYGALTFADKTSVAGLPIEDLNSTRLSSNDIEQYVSDSFSPPDPSELPYSSRGKSLDAYREKARQEVKEAVEDIDPKNSGLYTIQLPTGFGKTVSALTAATKIYEQKPKSNIIYSLPLTSIIDQTADVIESVFGVSRDDPEFTVHHHLSETTSELVHPTENSSEIDGFDINTLHAETWQSDITVTTFVQLFESLTAPKNKQSMKLAGIQNSVIIIDEIQSLPIKWWSIITKIIQELVTEYNCHIISITATHPHIYHRDLDSTQSIGIAPKSLIDPDPYYSFLQQNSRVQFSFHESVQKQFTDSQSTPIEPEQITTEICNRTDQSIAVVSNTVNSATEITNSLNEKLSAVSVNEFIQDNYLKIKNTDAPAQYLHKNTDLDTYLLHITSRLRPADRKILLKLITQLTESDQFKDTQLYVSATQVFEAGVDVSFECIYRDLAPAASLVQTAGRCNRAYEGDSGEIVLYHLNDTSYSSGTTPAELIYTDQVNQLKYLSSLTSDPTKKHTENEIIYQGIHNYYTDLFESEESKSGILVGQQNLLESYEKADSKTLRENSIIDMSASVDLVIPPTKQLVTQLQNDISVLSTGQLMKKYQDYCVSVPQYKLENSTSIPELREEFISSNDFKTSFNKSDRRNMNSNILFCIEESPTVYTETGIDLTKTNIDTDTTSSAYMF